MFPQQSLDLTIPEDRPVNSTYFLPVATDRDSTKYGIADYELQSHTGGENSMARCQLLVDYF